MAFNYDFAREESFMAGITGMDSINLGSQDTSGSWSFDPPMFNDRNEGGNDNDSAREDSFMTSMDSIDIGSPDTSGSWSFDPPMFNDRNEGGNDNDSAREDSFMTSMDSIDIGSPDTSGSWSSDILLSEAVFDRDGDDDNDNDNDNDNDDMFRVFNNDDSAHENASMTSMDSIDLGSSDMSGYNDNNDNNGEANFPHASTAIEILVDQHAGALNSVGNRRGMHTAQNEELPATARSGLVPWGQQGRLMQEEWRQPGRSEHAPAFFNAQQAACKDQGARGMKVAMLIALQLCFIDGLISATFAADPTNADSFFGWLSFQIVHGGGEDFRARIMALVPGRDEHGAKSLFSKLFLRARSGSRRARSRWDAAWRGESDAGFDFRRPAPARAGAPNRM